MLPVESVRAPSRRYWRAKPLRALPRALLKMRRTTTKLKLKKKKKKKKKKSELACARKQQQLAAKKKKERDDVLFSTRRLGVEQLLKELPLSETQPYRCGKTYLDTRNYEIDMVEQSMQYLCTKFSI